MQVATIFRDSANTKVLTSNIACATTSNLETDVLIDAITTNNKSINTATKFRDIKLAETYSLEEEGKRKSIFQENNISLNTDFDTSTTPSSILLPVTEDLTNLANDKVNYVPEMIKMSAQNDCKINNDNPISSDDDDHITVNCNNHQKHSAFDVITAPTINNVSNNNSNQTCLKVNENTTNEYELNNNNSNFDEEKTDLLNNSTSMIQENDIIKNSNESEKMLTAINNSSELVDYSSNHNNHKLQENIFKLTNTSNSSKEHDSHLEQNSQNGHSKVLLNQDNNSNCSINNEQFYKTNSNNNNNEVSGENRANISNDQPKSCISSSCDIKNEQQHTKNDQFCKISMTSESNTADQQQNQCLNVNENNNDMLLKYSETKNTFQQKTTIDLLKKHSEHQNSTVESLEKIENDYSIIGGNAMMMINNHQPHFLSQELDLNLNNQQQQQQREEPQKKQLDPHNSLDIARQTENPLDLDIHLHNQQHHLHSIHHSQHSIQMHQLQHQNIDGAPQNDRINRLRNENESHLIGSHHQSVLHMPLNIMEKLNQHSTHQHHLQNHRHLQLLEGHQQHPLHHIHTHLQQVQPLQHNLNLQHEQNVLQHQHNISQQHHLHQQQYQQYQQYQTQLQHNLQPRQQQSPTASHISQSHHHLQNQHDQTQHRRMQQQQQINHSVTCIDDLMIDEQPDDANNGYKLQSPNAKLESQDDGYETSAGDVLTPNSHTSSSHPMTPQHQIQHPHQQNLNISSKCKQAIPHNQQSLSDDPYKFIDEEINNSMHLMTNGSPNSVLIRQQDYPHHQNESSDLDRVDSIMCDGNGSSINSQQTFPSVGNDTGHIQGILSDLNSDQLGLTELVMPKKRGRKKKIRDENGTIVNDILKPVIHKERKKHDRFNGVSEEEVSKRTLPDHLTDNLDIIIIGINPGLFAAYKGHHYAGPGNHFWKCLYLSGLTKEQMTAEEDFKLINFGIGFTNMVERATKGSADLTRKEIKEGCRVLMEKLKKIRPKIAVFNGKLIFEVFSGKKDFSFGRQPECIEGTNTYMWVMPSSSARCAQLPRAADKVPFYAALKKFRDYLNGLIPHIDESECVFSDPKFKQCFETDTKSSTPILKSDMLDNSSLLNTHHQQQQQYLEMQPPILDGVVSGNFNSQTNKIRSIAKSLSIISNNCDGNLLSPPHDLLLPEKKKRGRPKKVKGIDGCILMEDGQSGNKISHSHSIHNVVNNSSNSITLSSSKIDTESVGSKLEIPKKKRGRPKKLKLLEEGCSNAPTTSKNKINKSILLLNNTKRTNTDLSTGITSNIIMNSNILSSSNNSCSSSSSNNGIEAIKNNNSDSLNNLNSNSMQQRLFSPPIHSPSTVRSYCPIGLNTTSTNQQPSPPINSDSHIATNTNSCGNNTISNSNYQQTLSYHHSSHHQQQTLQSYSVHSDLSSEISAAITSSERLGESSTPSSPSLAPVDFDPSSSMQTDDTTNPNDLRYSSPDITVGEPNQNASNSHVTNHYTSYRNPDSNNSFMTTSENSPNTSGNNYQQQIQMHQQGINNRSNGAIVTSSVVVNPGHRTHSSKLPIQMTADVASKSLSGLESLVDQIPTISDNETNTTTNHSLVNDEQQQYLSPNQTISNSNASANVPGCLYTSYPSSLHSASSSPSLTTLGSSNATHSAIHVSGTSIPGDGSSDNYNSFSTSNNQSNLPPSHHYSTNSNYSVAAAAAVAAGLSSNFSVSSLTGNNYSTSSYHSNLMAAAASAAASPHSVYMDPHMPMPVNHLYHHSYGQHSNYGSYAHVGPPPPTLHMPSPNYPYGYPNAAAYPGHQTAHHPSHSAAAAAAAAGYLSSHTSMFDRIKPDIGYGGF